MKRIFTPLTCLLIAILTGCVENISVGKRVGAINIADVTAKKLQGPVYGETDAAAAAAAAAAVMVMIMRFIGEKLGDSLCSL